jgi:hypothetical protein
MKQRNKTKTEHVTSSESVDGAKIMPTLGMQKKIAWRKDVGM